MTELDYEKKVEEVETSLNDPSTELEPAKIWRLLAEISHHDVARLQAARR